MAQQVPPYPALPKAYSANAGSLLQFDMDLNRALTDYLGKMARRANDALQTNGDIAVNTLTAASTATFNGPAIFNSTMTVVSADPSAAEGPVLLFDRNSASPAANDLIGGLHLRGKDSLGNTDVYASIFGVILDPTNGSEDGRIELRTVRGGTATLIAAFDGTAGLDLTIGRLKFPAVQNASTDANTLDEYEEGTFTPTVTATSGTFTTVSATLKYTKIGNVLNFQTVVDITTVGTAANAILVTLPFTPANSAVIKGREVLVVGSTCHGTIAGSALMEILKYDNTSIIGTGHRIVMSGQYFV